MRVCRGAGRGTMTGCRGAGVQGEARAAGVQGWSHHDVGVDIGVDDVPVVVTPHLRVCMQVCMFMCVCIRMSYAAPVCVHAGVHVHACAMSW